MRKEMDRLDAQRDADRREERRAAAAVRRAGESEDGQEAVLLLQS